MTARAADRQSRRRRWRAPIPEGRRAAVVTATAGLAATGVAVRFVAATLANAPGGPSGVGIAAGTLTAGTTGLAALAAVAVALTERDPVSGTGLLFVGVFGLLSLLVRAVTLPAAVAVVAGTVAVAVAHRRRLTAETGIAVGTLLVALGVGLASGVGGVVSLRSLGSTLALAGIALTPLFAATTGRAALAGCLAFAVVVAVGLSLPFVTGAITLVGGGVVGASLPVVALAAGGAVTTASAASRRAEWALLAGVALLAFAGVPATLARAVPFALGVAILVVREGKR